MRRLGAALLVLASPVVAGCHDHHFARVEFAVLAADPDASATSSAVQIPQGRTVTVAPRIVDRDDATLDGQLLPADSRVLDVRTTPEGRLVLLGVAAGTTSLRVVVDGDDVGAVPAAVTPP